MKILAIALLAVSLAAGGVLAADNAVFATPKDKLSYAIGADIGGNIKRQAIDVNPDQVANGLKDVLAGGKTLLTEEEVRGEITAFQKSYREKMMAELKKKADKNKADGEKFLAENKKKEGIVVLPSGLQYKVLKSGSGASPKATDTVETNYRGTLIDGTEFDSSYKRGKTATFPVNGVIAGWTEALQKMKVGDKWQLFLPPGLAYGESGAGQVIGPNETLIFEVELLGIK